jgi:YYY domain-containing protein
LDIIYFLLWWAIVEIIGWLALPIAMRVMGWLPDHGYTFAKSIGLLIASYILWLGGSTHFLRNDLGGILAAILIMTGISAVFFFKENRTTGQTPQRFVRENKKLVLTVEILFTVSFAAWAILRAYAPDKIMSAGGEKFMEITFLNAILNSQFFPPLDPWLSGFAISYYYYGYIMMAFLTRLSGVAAGVGFDLYDALLFALTTLGAFGVTYNLISVARKRKHSQTSPQLSSNSLAFGTLGGVLVAIMGNLEGLLEVLYSAKALPESFWKWINIPDLATFPASGKLIPQGYWWQVWWHASRVLQDLDLNYNPAPVSPITEFPSFSFILGDNHPHVLALPFVLLAIALALAVLLKIATKPPEDREETTIEANSVNSLRGWRLALIPFNADWVLFFFAALVLGALAFLNTWDFPIYLGLLLLAYLTGEFIYAKSLEIQIFKKAIVLGIELLFASILMYIFFYIGFGSQAGGILPYVFPPTRLPQYLVIFGPFIFILFAFLFGYAFYQSQHLQEKKEVIISWLKTWGWILLICAIFFALILLAAALSGLGQQLAQGQAIDPVIQSVLGTGSLSQVLGAILLARLKDPWLLLVLTGLIALVVINFKYTCKSLAGDKAGQNETHQAEGEDQPEQGKSPRGLVDLFVFILSVVGIALTLSVEFFYLRDSFGWRMNTVFKFYYQGWVMMGLASAYGLWWIVNPGRKSLGKFSRALVMLVAGLLISGGMVYPILSGLNRVNNFSTKPNLDGASGVASSNPQDWAAIEWLQKNAEFDAGEVPIILEAPGGSYNYEGRISAFTGFPAVLGWAVHESQWRGSYEEQSRREADIVSIYTSSDENLTLELLNKWQVDYVIFGSTEHSYIQRMCLDQSRRCNLATVLRKFDQALIPVFSEGQMTIYQVP